MYLFMSAFNPIENMSARNAVIVHYKYPWLCLEILQ